MFLRALVLTILSFCTVAATLPLTDSLAHWSSRPSASRRQKGRVNRRHSRAWWRRYRARLRRQRAVAAERRRRRAAALAASTVSPFAPANHAALTTGDRKNLALFAAPLPTTASLSSITPVKPLLNIAAPKPLSDIIPMKPSPIAPVSKDISKELSSASVLTLPGGWSSAAANRAGEMHFNVRAADGRVRATAVWSRVNVQAAAPSAADPRGKFLGGVPVTFLRRTVIDRMVAEGGWVMNDMQRQFGERRVFIVIALSVAANGERRALTFYFTESDGQIYSLATNAPVEFADSLAAGAEQAVAALGSRRANSTTAQFQH